MNLKHLIFIHLIAFITLNTQAQDMNNQALGKILESTTDSISGQPGYWQLKIYEHYLLVITDESHNRMRIISPIAEVKELESVYLENALKANFHTALDVKYAISEGIMWAVFIHPLKELSDHQVNDAISQVYRAAATFGTTYSSTDLVFPGGAGATEEEQEEAPKEETDKKKKTSKT